MDFSLSASLGNSLVKTGDANARAYIAAVVATGTSVSATQRTAINNFYKDSKSNGYYTSLKRLYLPIWGSASANAIDLIGLTSGTFVGGVTHGSGFVQGNGLTGYFNVGATPAALGITSSSAHFCFASLTNFTNVFPLGGMGGNGSGITASSDFIHSSTNGANFRWSGTGTGRVIIPSARQGILSASREGGNRRIAIRTTAARTLLTNVAGADAGVIPANNLFFLATNNTNAPAAISPAAFNDGQIAFYGLAMGLTDSQDTSYTLNLKTLWETCTGLTLP